MDNGKKNIQDLMAKYLNGTISQEEESQFFDWICEEKENKQTFFEFKLMYDSFRMAYASFDPESSWHNLMRKIEQKRKRNMFRFYLRVSAGVAACLLFILVSGGVYRHFAEPSPVLYSNYITGNPDDTGLLELPDGTLIHVGPKTSIRYGTDFNRKSRIVYLEGEAFFDVAKNADKPFIVKTNGQEIEVLGTRFNVFAYSTDSLYMTTLQEGSVKMRFENQDDAVYLKPNQQLIFNRNRCQTEIQEVDAKAASSWTDGYYHFQQEPLSVILQRISHVYDVRFRIASGAIGQIVFSGTFCRSQTINEILDLIKMSLPSITYHIYADSIEIKSRE